MTRMRTLAGNAGLALASFAIAGAVVEMSCRGIEAASPRRAPVASYIADWAEWDGDFYTIRTTAAGTPSLPDYNHDGVRDRDHVVEKPPGVRRVACLGDSTTMGWGVRPGESYPALLQDRLHAAGRPVEVFNVALPGWTTRQERLAYERLARRYRVDQVLLGICLNDIPEMQNNLSRPPRMLAMLHRHSAAVRRVVRAEERQIADVHELFDVPAPPRVTEAWQRTFSEIRRLRDAVRGDGAAFAVVVLPFAFQTETDAPPPLPQRTLQAFCAAEQIPFLDVLPAIRDAGETAFIDYDHLSPLGAAMVADHILSSGLIDDAPPLPPAGARSGARAAPDAAALVASLRDPDPRKRAAAARALGGMGSETRPEPLVEMLRDPSPDVRASAAWALGALGAGDAAASEALGVLLRDHDARARAGAAYALGRIAPSGKSAVAPLIAALSDPDDVVRWRAADALVRVGPPSAAVVDGLREVVDFAGGRGRAEAARVLGSFGAAAAPAVPSLIRALADRRLDVRARSLWALGEIGPAAAAAIPAITAETADPAVRGDAIDALGAIGAASATALPALVGALSDASPAVRRRAATALGRIGPAAAAAGPALALAAADANGDVRLSSLQALGRVGADPQVGLPPLLAALEDRDERTRAEAAHALGRIGPPASPAVPRILPLLGDAAGGVRAAAARALGRIGSLSATERQALALRRDDPDERVRDQARKALQRLEQH